MKDGKGERCCLLDGGNSSVHVKERVDSWGVNIQKEASIVLLNIPWRRKKKYLVDGIVRGRPTTSNVIIAVLRG